MSLNNFGPFDSDVWGNVSDWTMVLVTGATGILIWMTLKSQVTVQKLQQRITEIEQDRHRINLLPKYKLKSANPEVVYSENHYLLPETTVTLDLNNFPADNVKTTCSSTHSGWTFSSDNSEQLNQKPKTRIVYRVSYDPPVDHYNYRNFGLSILEFVITYCDQYGNQYRQEHSLAIMLRSSRLVSKPPELIYRAPLSIS